AGPLPAGEHEHVAMVRGRAQLLERAAASGPHRVRAWMRHEEMSTAGTRSLQWLADIQCSETGEFAPIGSNGFYRRGGHKALFDQQPVEACAMVSACLAAGRTTGDARWTQHARRAFGWFLGKNHLQRSMYDATTGGCRDGIHADRMNENQGAESTLSFLLTLSEMRSATRTPITRDGTP